MLTTTKDVMMAALASVACTIHPPSASAQTAKDVKGATPLVAIQNEVPRELIVDPPISEQLALGRVFIQYRTENLRILPVFGKAALEVSPRVGHLHYFLDDLSWPTVDTSGETMSSWVCRPARTKYASNWRTRFTGRSPVAAKWWSSRFPLPRRNSCARELQLTKRRNARTITENVASRCFKRG